MSGSSVFGAIITILILAKWAVELLLERLNQNHVLAHAASIPEPLRNAIDAPTYAKSIQYTLAKSRFRQIDDTFDAVLLVLILWSGVLPWAYQTVVHAWGRSAWSMAAFLFATGVVLTLPKLPFQWYAQFHLEERFGFNTTKPGLWWLDRLKGLVLGLILGYPLMVLLLRIVDWAGSAWWLWAWIALVLFQLVMVVLAPIVIMPLFNKFTPLPEGSLRDRLFALAQRTGFRAKSIQVMDGSKRSRHSNAFFTGFGRLRKIVLFDTLIQQLSEPELEAVLAHEIGHYKKKHIHKFMAASMAGSLLSFYILAFLASQDWFYRAFGFDSGDVVPALLLFGLLGGVASYWLSPLLNFWSRRYEYQADAFASRIMEGASPLTSALRKLNEKNLSNLTPHKIYSAFYYSHPTLLEREQALIR